MNPLRLPAVLLLSICCDGSAISHLPAADPAKPKDSIATKTVKVVDITLTVPKTWKQTPVTSKLRKAQFRIPPVRGDRESPELVVYYFGGGGGNLESNLRRWIGEFRPRGLTTKITTGKSSQGDYAVADLRGTYLGPSFKRRKTPLKNARMLSVMLFVKQKGYYYLKVSGPQKTIDSIAGSLRTAFGGNTKTEKKFQPEPPG